MITQLFIRHFRRLEEVTTMLTLEIYGKFITWPEAFALLMMKHYREHRVPFIVHRNCVHTGWNTSEEKTFINAKFEGAAEVQEDLCYCHQLT
jgi:hypothetical protein